MVSCVDIQFQMPTIKLSAVVEANCVHQAGNNIIIKGMHPACELEFLYLLPRTMLHACIWWLAAVVLTTEVPIVVNTCFPSTQLLLIY